MNMRRPPRRRELTPEVEQDVRRIEAMWHDCRARFAKGGSFLFGAACAADAMYAPVVSRFHTYDIAVADDTRAYMQAVIGLPAWREWVEGAHRESWVLPRAEVDWPNVLKA